VPAHGKVEAGVAERMLGRTAHSFKEERMASREHLVRAMWTLFEPIHAVSYFSPQSRDAFAAVGLTR
jgi:hypothetical protein